LGAAICEARADKEPACKLASQVQQAEVLVSTRKRRPLHVLHRAYTTKIITTSMS